MTMRSGARRAWLLTMAAGLLGAHCSAGAAAPAAAPVLLVLGDSLSAEYGIPRDSGWVALLAQRLQAAKSPLQVVNASISGDTTAGGRSRLPALLEKHHPAVLVIELGGNDALRGLPMASTRENLRAMVVAAQAAGARVLLVGMQVPPNYGRTYGEEFGRAFQELARERKTALLPFLLAGVADRPDADAWFQADRIHPLARAHPRLLDNVWGALQPVLPR